jgi:hypothetical protein
MKTPTCVRELVSVLVLGMLLVGCEGDLGGSPKEKKSAIKPAEKKPVGKNVYFEVQGKSRRVIVEATVCLRQGQLEMLLCRKFTKEHESILSADVDARQVHAALLAAGAEAGAPVSFVPGYKPASGTRIRVTLQYKDKGKTVTVPARDWIRNARTRKALEHDWVFAGSQFVQNPLDPKGPSLYLANEGDVICVSNFETAMLDLPIVSPKDNDELVFEAYTERIPAIMTPVNVILEPIVEAKKK